MKKTDTHGKRFKETKSKNKIFVIIIILFILAICAFFAPKVINGNNLNKNEIDTNTTNDINENNSDLIETMSNQIAVPLGVVDDMPDKMQGYTVIGQIVIDKINVDNYILNKTTDDALDVSVTKFYGPDINTKGNFCITGHNYDGLFKELRQLEKNDTFYLIDKKTYEKVTYKIYDIYTVYPTNLECLDQNTNNKREVTLITCNPSGVTRLILKAVEV